MAKARTTMDKAHPMVRFITDEMGRQNIGQLEMPLRIGRNKDILAEWRKGTSQPRIDDIDKMLEVLGLELLVVRRKENAGTVEELNKVAEIFGFEVIGVLAHERPTDQSTQDVSGHGEGGVSTVDVLPPPGGMRDSQ